MSTTVAQLTTDELAQIVEAAVERKLLELLGDPDEGLELRKSVRERLLRQKQHVEAGDRGTTLDDVVKQLGRG